MMQRGHPTRSILQKAVHTMNKHEKELATVAAIENAMVNLEHEVDKVVTEDKNSKLDFSKVDFQLYYASIIATTVYNLAKLRAAEILANDASTHGLQHRLKSVTRTLVKEVHTAVSSGMELAGVESALVEATRVKKAANDAAALLDKIVSDTKGNSDG